MDLFEHAAERDPAGKPLAERMRPRSLTEVVGQDHLLGEGRILARALQSGHLPSLILWGPPGTGKTTLARLLAGEVGAALAAVSAVSAGVKEVRAEVAMAKERWVRSRQRTVLFVDEVHRFSKTQQDAILPHVESGAVVLVGATTENPSFQVVAALLSRSRVVRLEPLPDAALTELAERALAEPRGLGELDVSIADDVLARLVARAGGDARRLLGALELSANLAGDAAITDDIVAEALQQTTLLYDRAGDEHYGVVSAFIKSMRGSDPDASVYWMTRMLEAGEDPLFVARRMVIFASEDVGNADPHAVGVAMAATQALQFVGMPEAGLTLTQLALYLALAPKSNTALTTYAAARRAVREHGSLPVPAKLLNASTALAKQRGHGAGYRYPHEFEGNYIAEEYLPDVLRGTRMYEPARNGAEAEMVERLESLRSKVNDCE